MENIRGNQQTRISPEAGVILSSLLRRREPGTTNRRLARDIQDKIIFYDRLGIERKQIICLTGASKAQISRYVRKAKGLEKTERKLPDEARIIELRALGLTHGKIAKKLEIERSAVTRCLLRTGNRTRGARKEISEKKRREIIRLYKEHVEQNDIARVLTIAESTVSRHLKRYKAEEFERVGKEIIRLKGQGMRNFEIADALKLKPRKVSWYLRKLHRRKKVIKRLPSEKINLVMQLGDELTHKEIASKLELPRSTVTSRLLRAGKRKRKPIKDGDIQGLYESGFGLKGTAERLEIAASTVYKHLNKIKTWKRKREPRQRLSAEKDDEIQALCDYGLKPKDVAGVLGISVSTVYRHLNKINEAKKAVELREALPTEFDTLCEYDDLVAVRISA
jgi:DNA-binding CsgD family transcriptional regulator